MVDRGRGIRSTSEDGYSDPREPHRQWPWGEEPRLQNRKRVGLDTRLFSRSVIKAKVARLGEHWGGMRA